jgi:peroxiredoxin
MLGSPSTRLSTKRNAVAGVREQGRLNLTQFTLHTTPDQAVALRDFRGQPVILAFYPADWSPICSDQMALYNEVLPEFRRFNAALLGISGISRGRR